MIAVIDYGVGNLLSLSSALRYLGLESRVTRDAEEIEKADRVILSICRHAGRCPTKRMHTSTRCNS